MLAQNPHEPYRNDLSWHSGRGQKHAHVRFGSKADICSALDDVRFTPNSDRKSGHQQTLMSALPPKADMCSATGDVCYGPIADIATYSITSSARLSSDSGTARPSILAVLRLNTNSNFVGRSIGSAAGSAPRATLPARTPTSRYKLSRFGP